MKNFLLTVVMAASPLLATAADLKVDIGSIRIQAPGVTVTFGTRDTRGYYWDWREHHGPRGEKYYTGRGNNGVPHQGGGFCPPGQAKKGNC